MLVMTIGRFLVFTLAADEFNEMPIFWRGSTLSGICLGVLAIIMTIAPQDRSIDNLFSIESRWETSLSTFISESVNPLALTLDGSHQNFFESASPSLLSVLIGGIIFLVLAWTTFFKLDVSVRKKTQIFSAALIWLLIIGWVINVVFSLTLWTVHNLNFWIFFVLILLLRWPFISINDFAPGARTVFGKGESKPR